MVREHITITPPKGAEFGSTDVIYLAVQASARERALELAALGTGETEPDLLRREARLRRKIAAPAAPRMSIAGRCQGPRDHAVSMSKTRARRV